MQNRLARVWPGSVAREWKVTVVNGERELVAACRAGDRDAFDRLVQRHQHAVYQVCFRFAGNHEDASDLAQDVFVRAFRALPRFKGESALATWLYRIAVNVCLNRRAAQPPPMEAIDPERHAGAAGSGPADAVLRRERSERLRAAISRLPAKQRATVVLRIYRELSHEEIARVLGSPVGTVKANFSHALANLRKLMGP